MRHYPHWQDDMDDGSSRAALADAASASVLQEGKVSVRKEGKRCRRARLSVAAEAAAEVSLLRADNVLLTLQRCAAWPHGKHGQVGCGRTV